MARGLKEQKALLKTIPTAKKASLEKIIETLQKEREQALDAEKVARSKADSIYWPIYNLDIKNPHQEIDTLESPEIILGKFRTTEQKISSIQDKIINVLTEALK